MNRKEDKVMYSDPKGWLTISQKKQSRILKRSCDDESHHDDDESSSSMNDDDEAVKDE